MVRCRAGAHVDKQKICIICIIGQINDDDADDDDDLHCPGDQ